MAMDYEKLTDDELLQLARQYLKGSDEYEQDPEEGARLMKMAADRGNTDALFDYGICLFNGEGVSKDDAAAGNCWKKAAEKGSGAALHMIGMCFMNGVCGMPKDPVKAADMFTKAAEKGELSATFHLAMMYENGLGVAKNPVKANEYLQAAVEKKFPAACFFQGMKILSNAGNNAAADAEGVNLIQLAAEAGEAQAQFVYGSLFQSGRGVEKDLAQAAGWYRRSAKAGFAPANQALRQLGFPGVQ